MPAFRGPDGRVVYVSDDEAERYRIGGDYHEVGNEAAGAAQSKIAPTDNGVLGSIGATVSAGLSGATLGASDWLLKHSLTQGQFEQLVQDRADNPFLSGTAQAAGMMLPALVSGGAATPAGALGRVAAEGIEAGRATGGALGAAQQLTAAGTEGAIANAGIYLSDVALGDRDLTAEGINGALGTGFLFGAAGVPVTHGIEAGTIAARRMFARHAAGGAETASAATSAWTEQAQKHLEAFDQAAELAQAKLAEAQSARQAAQLERLRANAEMADARAFTPQSEFPGGGVPGAAEVPGAVGEATVGAPSPGTVPVPGEPPEIATARALRDRAKALGGQAITPEEQAALQQQLGPGAPGFTRNYVAPGPNPLEALAQQPGVVAHGPATSVREFGLHAVPVTADEAELGARLAEYQDARRAFAELHAQVDPDLDALLRGLDPVELQRPTVPIGEFGAPGAGGFKSQEELAKLAAGTGREEGAIAAAPAEATQNLRGGARGTPVRSLGEVAAEQAPVPVASTPRATAEEGTAVGKRRPVAPTIEPSPPTAPETPPREIGSDKEFRDLRAAFRTVLDDDEIKEAIRYSREDYNAVNRHLRGREGYESLPESERPIIKKVDSMLEKARTPEALVTHRGASLKRMGDLQPGDMYTDPAYQSTSWRPDNIHRFGDVHVVITSPAGSRIAPIPSAADEGEFLLPRSTKLRITGREELPEGRILLHATVEDAGASPAAARKLPTLADVNRKPIESMSLRELEWVRRDLEETIENARGPARKSPEFAAANERYDAVSKRMKAVKAGAVPVPLPAETATASPFRPVDRPAGGSQGGGWFQDASGEHWFGKSYRGNADRVEVEHLANRIYSAFDVGAPETQIAEIGGRRTLLSREIKGTLPRTPEDLLATDAKHGFVVDAWLANHDVLGQDLDNMIVAGGKAHRIDNGGSMTYRAMGAPKEFAAPVSELETMRNPKRSAGRAFGSLTDDEVKSQLVDFARKYDERAADIDRMVDESGLSVEARRKIKAGLRERAEWLQAEAAKLEIGGPAAGDDLLAQLGATKSAMDRGETFTAVGRGPAAAARAEQAGRAAEAAERFRGRALESRPIEGPTRPPVNLPGRARVANRYQPISSEGHPFEIKQLELAHDAALERAATATAPAERAAAAVEARTIEQQLTAVGKRPGAVEDIAALAPAVTRIEKAAAALTEALGDAAPAAAKEHATAFRAAEDNASRKTTARIGQAADHAASERAAAANRDPLASPAAVAEDLLLGPSQKQRRIASAQKAQRETQAAFAKSRVTEAEAKIGAKQAADAAADAHAKLGPPPKAGAAGPGPDFGHRVVHGAHLVGYAVELGSELGIPGIPRPHDIPVIGPLLSAYLKYRAFRAAAGRFVGRVPATAETRAAAMAARTRDEVARAVDRSLGLLERNTGTVRRALTLGALTAADALGKRMIDDGQPDARTGATLPEQSAVRIREVTAAATNPALIQQAVRAQGRALTDPDLIDALTNHLVAMFQHLAQAAPKLLPPNPFTGKQPLPPPGEAMQWGQRVAIARDPQVAFRMLEAQTLTPSAADTLRAVYPKLFAEAQQRVLERAAELKSPVAYPQLSKLGDLLGLSLHPSHDPGHAAVLSGAHAPSAASAPAGPAQGGPPVSSIANSTSLESLYQTGADRRAGRM